MRIRLTEPISGLPTTPVLLGVLWVPILTVFLFAGIARCQQATDKSTNDAGKAVPIPIPNAAVEPSPTALLVYLKIRGKVLEAQNKVESAQLAAAQAEKDFKDGKQAFDDGLKELQSAREALKATLPAPPPGFQYAETDLGSSGINYKLEAIPKATPSTTPPPK